MSFQDSPDVHPPISSTTRHTTPIFALAEETFRFGEGQHERTRAYLQHLSAVAILAVDAQDRVLLVNQYRHPAGMRLWEIPAGLLDSEGESMLDTARRELHEEADLTATTWHTLVDCYTTPGCSNEAVRIYLAEGLSVVPDAELFTRGEEEAEIEPTWVPLADAVTAVLEGRIHYPSTISGVLALHAVRTGAGRLRDARAPWEAHPRGIAP